MLANLQFLCIGGLTFTSSGLKLLTHSLCCVAVYLVRAIAIMLLTAKHWRKFPLITRFRQKPRQKLFGEARTRILGWYALLMTGFIGLSIPVFSELVLYQVNIRVQRDLIEELNVFESFLARRSEGEQTLTQEQLARIFRDFLAYKIPEDDTFLLAILDGEFYGSSPRARPLVLDTDSQLMESWAKLTKTVEGEQSATEATAERIQYLARPIVRQGKTQGVFVAAHLSAGEIKEALDAVIVVIEVLLVGLVLGLILAWVASGKVLTPLRSLVKTARSISESDLSGRLPVKGTGEMAELARTFNEMMDRLQGAFNSQKAFINDAGHELRTPITIIGGHLELLGEDPQEQRETIDLVLDELDRMSRLVDDLLVLAKSERPDFLHPTAIDIETLTQEIYQKATALGRRHWQLERLSKGQLKGDRQRITQALMNLAQNAVQHTNDGDRITLGSAVEGQQVRFWVQDTGEGIAPSDHERIFERFARSSHSRRSEGSGLGLSIVRAIVQAHGGRIELTSEVGSGSTFTIVLPLSFSQARTTL